MGDSSDHTTVIDEGVEVGRTIEDRSPATVLVYRLERREPTACVVHLEEALPPAECVRTLEFHPDHRPDDWSRGDGTVQFDVVVPPTETRVVVLGIDATDDAPLGRDDPTISRSGLEASELPASTDAAPSGGSGQPSPADGSSELDMGPARVADGGDAASDPDSDDVRNLPEPNADGSTDTVEQPGESSEPADETEYPPAAAVAEGSVGADEEARSLVAALLGEIRAGHATEEELEALRSELGVARADEVRLRHVQSRMDDFEAYVDALEEIINRHGTASEFVDGIERQVTELGEALDAVRSELRGVEDGLEAASGERQELTEELAALDETVGELSEEVAELHELVESVDDRTATVEAELQDELAALREEREEQLDRLETDLEERREQLETEFEAELDSLRADVESFNQLRRRLLDAFGGGIESTPEDETAAE